MTIKRTNRTPSYRFHKRSGQAVVTLSGRDHYLGRHDTKESREAYDELIAQWLVNGRRMPDPKEAKRITVVELVALFHRSCQRRYGPRRSVVKRMSQVRRAMQPVKDLFGRTPAAQFGPKALLLVRERYAAEGWARKTVNDHIQVVKRMFKWAVREELAPSSLGHGLQAVEGLRAGESEAAEPKGVLPVPDAFVEAIKPRVSQQVWAMVQLQRLTGMRSGEVLIMRARDLDTAGPIWLYRPESHKTQHHGHERIVELGPRAQTVLKRFLKPDLDAYLFSPRDAVAKQNIKKRRKRKSKVQPSQRDRSKSIPKRAAGDRYSADSYRQAIQRACDVADAKARANLMKAGEKPGDERIIPRWHPHQLRHNYATRIRKEFGVEAARILLGHRSTAVTELYAEVDRGRVRDIVARVG